MYFLSALKDGHGASPTLGDLRNDLHTLKNDISKGIDDNDIEITTHLANKMVEFNIYHKQCFADIVNARCQL